MARASFWQASACSCVGDSMSQLPRHAIVDEMALTPLPRLLFNVGPQGRHLSD